MGAAGMSAAPNWLHRPSGVGRLTWLMGCALTPDAAIRFVYHPPKAPASRRLIYAYPAGSWGDARQPGELEEQPEPATPRSMN
jgi:hypothetical protein